MESNSGSTPGWNKTKSRWAVGPCVSDSTSSGVCTPRVAAAFSQPLAGLISSPSGSLKASSTFQTNGSQKQNLKMKE